MKKQTQAKPQSQGQNENVVINAYKEAFGKHYPQYQVEIKRGKSRDGLPQFHVLLNGDKGDRPLSLEDMREATQAFLH